MLVAKKWVPLNHSADFQSPDSLSEPSEIHLVFPRLWSIIIHQFCFCEIRSSMWFDSLGNVVVWSTKFTNWGAARWIRKVHRGGVVRGGRSFTAYAIPPKSRVTIPCHIRFLKLHFFSKLDTVILHSINTYNPIRDGDPYDRWLVKSNVKCRCFYFVCTRVINVTSESVVCAPWVAFTL